MTARDNALMRVKYILLGDPKDKLKTTVLDQEQRSAQGLYIEQCHKHCSFFWPGETHNTRERLQQSASRQYSH